MSYDGGLEVKIENQILLRIFRDYQDRGLFDKVEAMQEWVGVKYKKMELAFAYEYEDCAYVKICPKNLGEVLDAMLKLLDVYLEDEIDPKQYKHFKKELQENKKLIDENYTFVKWIYAHGDYEEEIGEETFKFNKGKEHYGFTPWN